MSSFPEARGARRPRPGAWLVGAGLLLACALVTASPASSQSASSPSASSASSPSASPYPGIGRPATAKEIAAWDIDVRPDFKGLPPGSGSVAQGMEIWEGKCASCHGIFGESNEVFSPLIGGTTKDDMRTGRVRRLTDESFPGRTTMMKLSSLSTLWDYVNRAMPWNAPKSLKTDEVYAVVAYMLNLAEVVPENFTLSDRNIAEVQQRLPNRHGMTTDHGMWPGRSLGNGGRPDVKAVACMSNCATEPKVASLLPDHARNAHGNLAEQNRLVGAQHGADTTKPGSAVPVRLAAAAPAGTAAASPAAPAASAAASAAAGAPAGGNAAAIALFNKHSCNACHGIDRRLVGPGMQEVARKHAARTDRLEYLGAKIVGGGAGVWGAIPMPPQNLPKADADAIARWVAAGAGK